MFIIDSHPGEWSEQHLLIFCHISSAKNPISMDCRLGFTGITFLISLCTGSDNNANKLKRMSWKQSSLKESDGSKYDSVHCSMSSSLHVKYTPKIRCISRRWLLKATCLSSGPPVAKRLGAPGAGLFLGEKQHASAALPSSCTCRQVCHNQISCPVGPPLFCGKSSG